MKKDSSEEKLFLEYLDRLLAGQDITVGGDVSDEARSALEHARRMLALRQEPSAAFKADLRNRLLRQMAQQPEPTGRAGFWERFDSVLPPRPVLVAAVSTVAVLFLAFIGVVWYAGRGGAPMATIAPPTAPSTAEYAVRLPANNFPQDVSFTTKTSLSASTGEAEVYRIQSSDITTQSVAALGRKLGFTGQAGLSDDGTKIVMSQGSGNEARQLTVWTASGGIEYGYVEPEKLYPSAPPALPSQSQAETIAYDFLQEADLLPVSYQSLAQIKDETTVAAGGGYSVSKQYAAEAALPAAAAPSMPFETTEPSIPPGTTYWLVEFPYFVDGMEATGPGSRIEVSVGDNGEVVKLDWSWRPMSPLGQDNIISEQQAFQELMQGKGSIELPLDCRMVLVNQVQLKYWLDPPSEKQDFIVPVYEFTGTCLDKNGNTLENFTGWTPALSTN
jgi:hypothetical protein